MYIKVSDCRWDGILRPMTAKEALLERVHDLSEAEAEEWLSRLEWDSTETDTLTPEEFAEVLAGRREHLAGLGIDGEEVFRELGL